MPQTTSTLTNKISKRTVKLALIGLVSLAIIVIAIFAVLYFVQKSNAINVVKEDLNKAVASMESKKLQTGAYPSTISDVLSAASGNVTLTGSSSFDGTSFCITGINSSDKSAEFYVDSSKREAGPISGSCDNRSDLPAPAAPGGLATVFSVSTDIKLSWNATTYATEYTVQCSADSNFTTPVTVKVNENSATCEKLKPNTGYFCRDKASNKAGDGNWSAVLKTSTLNYYIII